MLAQRAGKTKRRKACLCLEQKAAISQKVSVRTAKEFQQLKPSRILSVYVVAEAPAHKDSLRIVSDARPCGRRSYGPGSGDRGFAAAVFQTAIGSFGG
jgi:hypothetical protein